MHKKIYFWKLVFIKYIALRIVILQNKILRIIILWNWNINEVQTTFHLWYLNPKLEIA